jgi:two-component system alkaline phosphatase synthesis response regulator PhoP
LARIRAALRRCEQARANVNRLAVGDLEIDLIGRKVTKGDDVIKVSHKEFDLLVELVQNKGAVLSRDLLLTKVWGYDYVGGTRTVDVHIRWLREKIEADPSNPQHIQTIRGIGYRFEG